jgi:hypothetical protein
MSYSWMNNDDQSNAKNWSTDTKRGPPEKPNPQSSIRHLWNNPTTLFQNETTMTRCLHKQAHWGSTNPNHLTVKPSYFRTHPSEDEQILPSANNIFHSATARCAYSSHWFAISMQICPHQCRLKSKACMILGARFFVWLEISCSSCASACHVRGDC